MWILVSYTRFDYLFFMPLILNSLSLSLSPYSMIIWAKTWNKTSFHWAERLLKDSLCFSLYFVHEESTFFPNQIWLSELPSCYWCSFNQIMCGCMVKASDGWCNLLCITIIKACCFLLTISPRNWSVHWNVLFFKWRRRLYWKEKNNTLKCII